MKRISKTKLPKWIISRLPFGEEDETASSVIVPVFIFSCFGIIVVWKEFYEEIGFALGLIAFLSFVAIIIRIAVWLIVQIDILKILRKETVLRYKLTKDSSEKQKLENFLITHLCVKAQDL